MGIELSMNPRRLHDRKSEHFKAITSGNHSSAIADRGLVCFLLPVLHLSKNIFR